MMSMISRRDTNYAGTAWLLYLSNRFLAAKLRVWIGHVVTGLAL
jgi:hypothetical protein